MPAPPPEELFPLLRCPVCGGTLRQDDRGLRCVECSHEYEVVDGAPLLDVSGEASEAPRRAGPVLRLLHRAAANAGIYDAIQRAAGYGRVAEQLRPHLGAAEGVVVDVGAGTGSAAELVGPRGRYVWLDYDRQKLAGFRQRHPDASAVLADARRLPFADNSVDMLLTVAMSHHLDDVMLDGFLSEAARVAKGTLVYVDAVRSDKTVGRLLWKYDRGAVPRGAAAVRAAIERHFTVEHEERFSVMHDYYLCRARPS